MLDPKNVAPGEEQHETFRSSVTKKLRVQYDYRDSTGKLFSCTKPTLDECRAERDKWRAKNDI